MRSFTFNRNQLRFLIYLFASMVVGFGALGQVWIPALLLPEADLQVSHFSWFLFLTLQGIVLVPYELHRTRENKIRAATIQSFSFRHWIHLSAVVLSASGPLVANWTFLGVFMTVSGSVLLAFPLYHCRSFANIINRLDHYGYLIGAESLIRLLILLFLVFLIRVSGLSDPVLLLYSLPVGVLGARAVGSRLSSFKGANDSQKRRIARWYQFKAGEDLDGLSTRALSETYPEYLRIALVVGLLSLGTNVPALVTPISFMSSLDDVSTYLEVFSFSRIPVFLVGLLTIRLLPMASVAQKEGRILDLVRNFVVLASSVSIVIAALIGFFWSQVITGQELILGKEVGLLGLNALFLGVVLGAAVSTTNLLIAVNSDYTAIIFWLFGILLFICFQLLNSFKLFADPSLNLIGALLVSGLIASVVVSSGRNRGKKVVK